MALVSDRALFALEDGSVFVGKAFGARRTVVGEAVFNTSMTGYQEILTDPSYFGQIVTMTAPQIGNYGVNPEDVESDKPKAFGFVVRELSPVASNWRSRQDLGDYLAEHGIPGISGVDTRSITKRLRVHGALKACLTTEDISREEAVARARAWEGLEGVDYVKEVTASAIYRFEPGSDIDPFTVPGTSLNARQTPSKRLPIVAFDMGVKTNILRKLARHGFDVTVVPAGTTAETIRALEPRPLGIFISNGPGDPAAVTYAHRTIAELMPDYPMFGICMGHQVLTHAMGAGTMKLKFGHRGGNQPVKNIETGVVAITSQNHGFASSTESLESCGAVITEYNMNDQTVAGIRHAELPVFSVQYHPEASPGPHDSDPLFAHFYDLVAKKAEAAGF
jgi:carbamoyl-phosphate synthase small subunit